MTINVDLLRRELEFVTDRPDRWDQCVWFELPSDYEDLEPGVDWTCGTTACLAGWTALHTDHVPFTDDEGYTYDDVVTSPTGERHNVRLVAMTQLGLSRRQATVLFSGENNLRDLWEYAHVFTNGAIEVPATVRRQHTFTYDADDEDWYRTLGDQPSR